MNVILYGPPAVGKRSIAAALGSAAGRILGTSELAEVGPDALRVLLWAPDDVLRLRAVERGEPPAQAVTAGWERCYAELVAHPEATWAVAVRTDTVTVDRAAEIIAKAVAEPHKPAMTTRVLHRFLFR